jgi:hypothetical protein
MANNRDKLFDDPLSGLMASDSLTNNHSTAYSISKSPMKETSKSPLEGDPLSVSADTSFSNNPTKVQVSLPASGESLQSVDFDKVKLKATKKVGASALSNTSSGLISTTGSSIVESTDRFGLGVDLFGTMAASTSKKESVFDDIMSSTSKNSSTARDGLFSSLSSDEVPVNIQPTAVNPNASKFRVTYEKEDSKIEDLSVGKLVEAEELDFGLFGKASGTLRSGFEGRDQAEKSTAGIVSAKREDFEVNLTADYLNELESVASSSKDLSLRPQLLATSYEFQAHSTANEPIVDLADLNLDDYIAQQSLGSSQGGGLFD